PPAAVNIPHRIVTPEVTLLPINPVNRWSALMLRAVNPGKPIRTGVQLQDFGRKILMHNNDKNRQQHSQQTNNDVEAWSHHESTTHLAENDRILKTYSSPIFELKILR